MSNFTLNNTVPEGSRSDDKINFSQSKQVIIEEAQEIIYRFFIQRVKQISPEQALLEFKDLFIEQGESINLEVTRSLNTFIASQNELEFRHLFKRCCYILLNNWVGRRTYHMTQELIRSLSESRLSFYSSDSRLECLRSWLINFIKSQDYEELKLFVSKYENKESNNWTENYTSFLLVPQYINEKNPIEQRQAAQRFSKHLKEKFKFELALYTARVQSAHLPGKNCQNPTILGDDILFLIKSIVSKRGSMSYPNLAKTFLKQTRNLTYKDFKESLIVYLLYSEKETPLVKTLNTLLKRKIENLYDTYDLDPINSSLILMLCNKVIKILTIERVGIPSTIFNFLVTHGNPLTLAIMLLKLILISPHSRIRLEICLALLIKHYEGKPPKKCQEFIKFVEICKILLTIYAENVQYNLVKMNDESQEEEEAENLKSYRVFSQHKISQKDESQ